MQMANQQVYVNQVPLEVELEDQQNEIIDYEEEQNHSPGIEDREEIDSTSTRVTTVDTSIIAQMKQVGVLFDSQPIRAACFSPNNSEYFVLGTNSKSLKFCKMGNFEEGGDGQNHEAI